MVAIEAPRLLPAPADLRDPDLVDGTEWAGVDVVGEVGGEAEVESLTAVHFLGCDLTGADFSMATTSALACTARPWRGSRAPPTSGAPSPATRP